MKVLIIIIIAKAIFNRFSAIDLFEPDTFRFLHGFLIIGAFYKFNKTSGENKSSSEKMEENIIKFSRILYMYNRRALYLHN